MPGKEDDISLPAKPISPPGEGGGLPEATEEAEGDGVLSSLEMLAAVASANRQ